MAKRYGYKTSATRHKPGTGRFTEGKTEVAQISKGNPMYGTDIDSMRKNAILSEEQLKKLRKKRKDKLKGPLQQS
jgi:predicted GIY-YIG superfamily endonuclease